MSKNPIRYLNELKKQLELSREYCVTRSTIYNWLKQYSPVKVTDDKEIIADESGNQAIVQGVEGEQLLKLFKKN